ncbi:hypothetical protein HHI36_012482 [Cryptolaemus montrouzieri]|uniref:Uncharacterized protein n=1 Tax=Cryptolaemus montrouzieri TaxID=559131 RepID=A0ABD2NEK0_9CUCU
MYNAEGTSDDLINFNANSPSPSLTTVHDEVDCDNASDNLLDTELPELEQKLQTTNHLPTTSHSRTNSVDIEDILISIDDDYSPQTSTNDSRSEPYAFTSHEYSRSEEYDSSEEIALQELRSEDDSIENSQLSLSSENIEAIRVLESLDEILNSHLQENESTISEQGCDCIDVVTQQTIEECLSELDEFLRDLDSSYESDGGVVDDGGDTQHYDEGCSRKGAINISSTENFYPTAPSRTDSRASLRMKLRRIEENYAKYLSSGRTNREYLVTENEHDATKSKSLSSCCKKSEEWREVRSHFVNALATLPSRKKVRPKLLRSSLVELSGCSGTPETKDVQSERRAHASGGCCTGTVVVEAQRGAPTRGSSSVDVEVDDDQDGEVMVRAEPKDGQRQTSTWLRTSMRHLRHLRLPSDSASVRTSREGTVQDVPLAEPPTLLTPIPPANDSNTGRPFSAPSRLSRSDNSGVPSERPRSRSQTSRNSAVSLEPGGRGGRSSSASSASRRPRSLSSSETSLASSLETAGTASSVHAHSRSQASGTDTRR